jgi:hypothetical protein
VSYSNVAEAAGTAVAAGLVFEFYPSRQASRRDALRRE